MLFAFNACFANQRRRTINLEEVNADHYALECTYAFLVQMTEATVPKLKTSASSIRLHRVGRIFLYTFKTCK